MIGYLRGKLLQKQPPFLLLDVGGVGYELEAPMTTFYDLPDGVNDRDGDRHGDGADDRDETVTLFVHMVVREDAQLLFGFSDQTQRELFRRLLRINGVGPRVALAILSTLSTVQLIQCVHNEDAATLTRVPGIGSKTAQRMILDLRDRIGDLADDGADDRHHGGASATQDAIGALLALGYKPNDANRAVRAVESECNGEREELIRKALQYLSK